MSPIPRQFKSQGIVLARTNFGEADRILTFLTPDHGKVKAIAKGVRKPKSKLAGGIELFSVSDLSFIIGRGEINTLVSSRLATHYGRIVKDLNRTNLGYELIKLLNKITEENPEAAYFELLKAAFEALSDDTIELQLIEAWFYAQILRLAGHTPNLRTEQGGAKLDAGQTYEFDYENMCFRPAGSGFGAAQIKFLRLLFSDGPPAALQKVQGIKQLLPVSRQLLSTALGYT